MSGLPSQLTLAQPSVLARTGSAEAPGEQPRMRLRAIGEHIHALLVAQRPPTGQYGDSAWAAEDDYARLSNRFS
jgi:hypothetical protein